MASDQRDALASNSRLAPAEPGHDGTPLSESLRDIVKPANLLKSARRHKFAFLTLIVGLTLAFYLVWRIAEHEMTRSPTIVLDDGPLIGTAPRDLVGSAVLYSSRMAALADFAGAYPR